MKADRPGDPMRLHLQREAESPPPTEAAGRYQFLLDLDEDLACRFSLGLRVAVRPVITARVVELPLGDFDLEPLFARVTDGLGLLVVAGLVELDTRVGDRTASELLGDGDLMCPWQTSGDVVLLARARVSRALLPVRIAILDQAFLRRAQPWPQVTSALIQRGVRRAMSLNLQRAATCHPRAEVRVDLLLWQLAERWGKVQPDGIQVTLPLTHRLIGQLVGVERPSVSHALSRLSRAGLVTRSADGLVLRGTAEHHIECLVERRDSDEPSLSEQGPVA